MKIQKFLNPRSIAIIWASRNHAKVGNIVTQNLIDAWYTWKIYPINLKADTINGLKAYAQVQALPEIPELCIVSLPIQYIMQELQEAVDTWCDCFVVFTAWFKEIGEEWARIEQELIAFSQKHNITLLWPNCLWYIHTPKKINATFAKAPMHVGDLTFISQSGAVVSALFDRCMSTYVWLDTCYTLGNKAILHENNILRHLLEQKISHRAPICMYLEQITDGKCFLSLTRELSRHRPLLLLKPGKSKAAQQAMHSHTWSIAGEDKVLQAVCNQAGIIRCHTIQEMFDLSMYFTWKKSVQGNRIAVITNAGGPWVIATDLIEEAWLVVAHISDHTKSILQEHLPRAASIADPIDVLWDAQSDRYAKVLEAVVQDTARIDCILLILTPQIMTQIEETARVITTISKKHHIPIVCTFVGQHEVYKGKKILREHHIPCYKYPVHAVQAISKARQREQRRRKQYISMPNRFCQEPQESAFLGHNKAKWIQKDLSSIKGLLDTQSTYDVLDTYGVRMPQSILIETSKEASTAAVSLSYPLVMKLVGPELTHKIDIWGVVTGIDNEQELQDVFAVLEAHRDDLRHQGKEVTIALQQQIQTWVECIIGIKKDKQFGDVLMFGAWWTLAELFDNHVMHILPATKQDLESMVQSSAVCTLLQGYRWAPACDISWLVDMLSWFIAFVTHTPNLISAEINPVIVNEYGARAVDPKIVLW